MSDDPDPDPEPDRGSRLGSDLDLSLQNPDHYPEGAAAALEPWLRRLVTEMAPQASSFAVRFVDDGEMRRINHRYRGIDRATDVLSFPGDAGPEGQHLGDVAISVPTAREQAASRRRPPEREVKILLLHGLLHCLGYDHEADDGEMARLERRLRRRWLDGTR